MKKIIMTVAVVATTMLAQATLETFNISSPSVNGVIPDGNLVGVTFAGSISDAGAGATVTGLTVGLNVSGGYDANLYAYLVAPNGTMVVLLNHPGVTGGTPFGNMGSGLNLTLADGEASITASANLNSGTTYAAAGSLSGFNGSVANGTWQLFFADTVSGGGTSVLNTWSLDLTVVPEPVNVAMTIFGLGFVGIGIVRCYRRAQNS